MLNLLRFRGVRSMRKSASIRLKFRLPSALQTLPHLHGLLT